MASARIAGVKSMTSSSSRVFRAYFAGLVGMGWVGAYHSPGTVPAGMGTSSMGQIGSPVMRSKTYR